MEILPTWVYSLYHVNALKCLLKTTIAKHEHAKKCRVEQWCYFFRSPEKITCNNLFRVYV